MPQIFKNGPTPLTQSDKIEVPEIFRSRANLLNFFKFGENEQLRTIRNYKHIKTSCFNLRFLQNQVFSARDMFLSTVLSGCMSGYVFLALTKLDGSANCYKDLQQVFDIFTQIRLDARLNSNLKNEMIFGAVFGALAYIPAAIVVGQIFNLNAPAAFVHTTNKAQPHIYKGPFGKNYDQLSIQDPYVSDLVGGFYKTSIGSSFLKMDMKLLFSSVIHIQVLRAIESLARLIFILYIYNPISVFLELSNIFILKKRVEILNPCYFNKLFISLIYGKNYDDIFQKLLARYTWKGAQDGIKETMDKIEAYPNAVSSSKLKGRIRPLINPDGICRGAATWFSHLYCQSSEFFDDQHTQICAVAKIFESGAPAQGVILQKILEENPLKGLEKTSRLRLDNPLAQETIPSSAQKINSLEEGPYMVYCPNHALVFVKMSDKSMYFWDPNYGLLKTNPKKLLTYMGEYYFDKEEKQELGFFRLLKYMEEYFFDKKQKLEFFRMTSSSLSR